MSTDYSILYNLSWNMSSEAKENKEVEEKYFEFLNCLKELFEKNKLLIIDRMNHENNIPIKFKDLIFLRKDGYNGTYNYCLHNDLNIYLDYRKINIYFYFKDCQNNKNPYGNSYHKDTPEFISFSVSNNLYEYILNKNILKIPKLEQKISSLEQTNQDILKKLEEQIQLNSKLCERIFEMKEEKFKEKN
jgi:hypothetical protein